MSFLDTNVIPVRLIAAVMLTKLVVLATVLVALLGCILYTPIPEGLSKPWVVQVIYSTKKLLNIAVSMSVLSFVLKCLREHTAARAFVYHKANFEKP